MAALPRCDFYLRMMRWPRALCKLSMCCKAAARLTRAREVSLNSCSRDGAIFIANFEPSRRMLELCCACRLIQISNRQMEWGRVLAAKAPEVLQVLALSSRKEGAGKTGCALHPRSRVQAAQ